MPRHCRISSESQERRSRPSSCHSRCSSLLRREQRRLALHNTQDVAIQHKGLARTGSEPARTSGNSARIRKGAGRSALADAGQYRPSCLPALLTIRACIRAADFVGRRSIGSPRPRGRSMHQSRGVRFGRYGAQESPAFPAPVSKYQRESEFFRQRYRERIVVGANVEHLGAVGHRNPAIHLVVLRHKRLTGGLVCSGISRADDILRIQVRESVRSSTSLFAPFAACRA